MKHTRFYLAIFILLFSLIPHPSSSQPLHFVNGYLSTADCNVQDMTIDNASNIYTVGMISQTTDFTSGSGAVVITPGSPTQLYSFITKTNPAGVLDWTILLESAKTYVIAICADNSGNLFITGTFGPKRI